MLFLIIFTIIFGNDIKTSRTEVFVFYLVFMMKIIE